MIDAALAASGSYTTTPAATLTEIAVTLIAARAKRKKKQAAQPWLAGCGRIASVGDNLVSGLAGFAVSGLLAIALWWLNSRTELEKTRLQIEAQTHQTRYPDLVHAASDFAAEMRLRNKIHSQHMESGGERLVDDEEALQCQEVRRDEPAAEVRLLTLEFFADDGLRAAAKTWLEAFYVAWYDKAQGARPEGAKGPYELLEDAAGHYLAEVRRALKVAGQVRG